MRVLILTNNISGLRNFRMEVVQAIVDSGYHLTISSPYDVAISYFENVNCDHILTSFKSKSKNPIQDFKLFFTYLKIIRKVKPDVVLTYTIKPNVYGGMACRILGVPQFANITGLGTAVETQGWMQKLTIQLYRMGLKKAHTVFFQNKANREFCLSNKMVRGHHVLIPGSGVNLTKHKYQEYPPEHPLRFVFISRLVKQKGIEHYLEAAEYLKEKYPDTEFHILGYCQGNYQEKLDDLQKRGVVDYHGRQLDVRPFFGMCHCTVHPSFYPEGMSNVLLESCANGRPIITTDRPGCGEIVDEGKTGFVVRQRDTHDLIEKMEAFIKLPYPTKRQMGIDARKRVEKEFDRNIVVKKYLDEIKNLENHN